MTNSETQYCTQILWKNECLMHTKEKPARANLVVIYIWLLAILAQTTRVAGRLTSATQLGILISTRTAAGSNEAALTLTSARTLTPLILFINDSYRGFFFLFWLETQWPPVVWGSSIAYLSWECLT
jgi:hypothetical protein